MGERGQKHLEQVAGFFGLDLTDAQIARIVDENSFQKRTKRKPGTEDRGAHARKGVVGDWRNVFLPTGMWTPSGVQQGSS